MAETRGGTQPQGWGPRRERRPGLRAFGPGSRGIGFAASVPTEIGAEASSRRLTPLQPESAPLPGLPCQGLQGGGSANPESCQAVVRGPLAWSLPPPRTARPPWAAAAGLSGETGEPWAPGPSGVTASPCAGTTSCAQRARPGSALAVTVSSGGGVNAQSAWDTFSCPPGGARSDPQRYCRCRQGAGSGGGTVSGKERH